MNAERLVHFSTYQLFDMGNKSSSSATALVNGVVIAKSSKIVYVDGNAYFPVNDVKMEYFSKTDFHTRCSWKGEADYYNVDIGGVKLENAAWQYPADTCTDACKDAGIAGYISFYTHKGVTVK